MAAADSWAHDIAEATGADRAVILTRAELAHMTVCAAAGDPNAVAYFAAVKGFACRCASRRHCDRPRCLTCKISFTPRRAPGLVVIQPAVHTDPKRAVVFGLCRHCARRHRDSLGEAVAAALRPIFPDLCLLPPPIAEAARD